MNGRLRVPRKGQSITLPEGKFIVADFRMHQGDAQALCNRMNAIYHAHGHPGKAKFTRYWKGPGYVIVRPDDGTAPEGPAPGDNPAMREAMA